MQSALSDVIHAEAMGSGGMFPGDFKVYSSEIEFCDTFDHVNQSANGRAVQYF